MSGILVVLTTFGDGESAKTVVRELVGQGVVACVNLIPGATSVYRWGGKVCEEEEVMAVMKTTEEGYERLETGLRELHPYEVPEILAIPVMAGSEGYLEFVRNAVEKRAQ